MAAVPALSGGKLRNPLPPKRSGAANLKAITIPRVVSKPCTTAFSRHLLTGVAIGVTGVTGRCRWSRSARSRRNAASNVPTAVKDWKGHEIRCCTAAGDGTKQIQIVLVHGFGGSIEYWRRLLPALSSEGYTVHAFDLLGLGLSEKPELQYSIELWADQVKDFVEGLGTENVVLVGNSFGSLISLLAATKLRPKGIIMLNCAVGMNNKNMIKSPKMNDFQRLLASVALKLVDLIFKSPLLDAAFKSFANKEQVSAVLKNLYPTNPAAVDDELAEGFVSPAATPGALAVLRQIYTGDPGPTPMEILGSGQLADLPMKVIWGDQDSLTPIKGDVGSFLTQLAKERSCIDFEIISAGHLPHDENPEAVNKAVLEWLAREPWRSS